MKIKNQKLKNEICYVELIANVEERLIRNKSPNRLQYKPSKTDFEASERELLEADRRHTLNSSDFDFKKKNYLKIDNTNTHADVVSKMIKERFCL